MQCRIFPVTAGVKRIRRPYDSGQTYTGVQRPKTAKTVVIIKNYNIIIKTVIIKNYIRIIKTVLIINTIKC